MKLMQSGIDFFADGTGAAFGCACECLPESGNAKGFLLGEATTGCGCFCGCTGEARFVDRNSAKDWANMGG